MEAISAFQTSWHIGGDDNWGTPEPIPYIVPVQVPRLSGWKQDICLFLVFMYLVLFSKTNHEAHPGSCSWFPCYYDVSYWSCHLSGMDLVIELCGDKNYWEGKHKYIQFSQIFFLYYFLGRIPFGTNLKGTSQWFSTLAEIFLKIPGLWGRRLSVWTLHPHPRLIKCDATGVAPGIVLYLKISLDCCHCQVASVLSDSVQPHRQQPTRLPHPWDSPGKNTGVDCHFLLQCMKVKSEREVAQSCLTLATPWTTARQAPLSMGFSEMVVQFLGWEDPLEKG